MTTLPQKFLKRALSCYTVMAGLLLHPNAETAAALNEYAEMKAHPEKYKRYASFKDAMNEVLTDA